MKSIRPLAAFATATLAGCQQPVYETTSPRDNSPLGIHNRMMIMDAQIIAPVPECTGTRRVPRDGPDRVLLTEGGIDVGLWQIPTPPDDAAGGAGFERLLQSIQAARCWMDSQRGQLLLAKRAGDAPAMNTQGKQSLYLGLADGDALSGDVEEVARLHAAGVRFVRLVNGETNALADAAGDEPRWGGLSPAGRFVIAEANRIGLVIDGGGLSRAAFGQLLRLSRAAIIYSQPANARVRLDTKQLRALQAADGTLISTGDAGASLDAQEVARCHSALYRARCAVGGFTEAADPPALTEKLLSLGYDEGVASRMWGYSVLRVLRDAEVVAGKR